VLFDYGIDALAGTVVVDPESLREAVLQGATWGIFNHGAQMVKVNKRNPEF
jgi:hypothetical protein